MSERSPLNSERNLSTVGNHGHRHGDISTPYFPTDTMIQRSRSATMTEYGEVLAMPYGQRHLPPLYKNQLHEQRVVQRFEKGKAYERDDVEDFDNYSGSDAVMSDPENARTQRAGRSVDQRYHDRGRMQRFRLTHSQTRFLMSEFARQPHPDATERQRLSREIPGLTPRQVQIWFQNRRAKLKRLTAEDRNQMIRSRMLPEDFHMSNPLRTPFDRRSSLPGDNYTRLNPMVMGSRRQDEFVMNKVPTIFGDFRRPSTDGLVTSPTDISPQSSTPYQHSNYSTSLGYGHRAIDQFPMRNIVGGVPHQSYTQDPRKSGSIPSVTTPGTPQSLLSPFERLDTRVSYYPPHLRSDMSFASHIEPDLGSHHLVPEIKSQGFQALGIAVTDASQSLRASEIAFYDEADVGRSLHRTSSGGDLAAAVHHRLTNSHSYESLPRAVQPSLSPSRIDQQVIGSRAPHLSLEIPDPYLHEKLVSANAMHRFEQTDKSNSAPGIIIDGGSRTLQSQPTMQPVQDWDQNSRIGTRSGSHTPVLPRAQRPLSQEPSGHWQK